MVPLRLECERLETRCLMAVDIMLDGTELSIVGNDEPNHVIIGVEPGFVVVSVVLDATEVVLEFDHELVNSVRFQGNRGDDTFINNSGIPSVAFGNAGNDTLTGGSADDVLHGGAGRDRLAGRGGDDELRGGTGDDRLLGLKGNDRLLGGMGNDYLSGHQGSDTLLGGRGDDSLMGHRGDDVLRGNAGRDLLAGGRGADTLIGSTGNNCLFGGTDILSDASAADTILGGARPDILRGRGSNDEDQSLGAKPPTAAAIEPWNSNRRQTTKG